MNYRQGLRIVFNYVLPFIGALCVLFGVVRAIYVASFDRASTTMLGLGLVLFLMIFVRVELANIRFYLHVTLYTVLVAGLCVIAYLFVKEYERPIDLTREKLFSLTPQSQRFLESLDQPTTITVVSTDHVPYRNIQEYYDRYTDRITWRYIDPVQEPLAARELGENVSNHDIFVESPYRTKRINAIQLDPMFVARPKFAERAFTNALMEVTRRRKPKIYFLTGHGEIAYESPAPSMNAPAQQVPSLTVIRQLLTDQGNETAPLDLVQSGAIPEDADVIVIAGPLRDLMDVEYQLLDNYLDTGGSMMVLLDPPLNQQMLLEPLTNLRKLLSERGIEVPDQLVVDLGSRTAGTQAIYPLLSSFDPEHTVTSHLALQEAREIFSSGVRPIVQGDVPDDLKFTNLVRSSARSFSVNVADLRSQIQMPDEEDIAPQTLVAAVGKLPPPRIPGFDAPDLSLDNTRLVVFGSSVFIMNNYLGSSPMGQLLMVNSLNWLTESSEMVALPDISISGTPIVMTIDQQRVILIMAGLLLPSLLFFGGISYSVLRRRR